MTMGQEGAALTPFILTSQTALVLLSLLWVAHSQLRACVTHVARRMNQIVPQTMIGHCLAHNDDDFLPRWETFTSWVIQASVLSCFLRPFCPNPSYCSLTCCA